MLVPKLIGVALLHATAWIALSLLTGWENSLALRAGFTISAIAAAHVLNTRRLNQRARETSSESSSLLNRILPPLAVGVSVYTLFDFYWHIQQGDLLEIGINLVVLLAAAGMLIAGVNAASE